MNGEYHHPEWFSVSHNDCGDKKYEYIIDELKTLSKKVDMLTREISRLQANDERTRNYYIRRGIPFKFANHNSSYPPYIGVDILFSRMKKQD